MSVLACAHMSRARYVATLEGRLQRVEALLNEVRAPPLLLLVFHPYRADPAALVCAAHSNSQRPFRRAKTR